MDEPWDEGPLYAIPLPVDRRTISHYPTFRARGCSDAAHWMRNIDGIWTCDFCGAERPMNEEQLWTS